MLGMSAMEIAAKELEELIKDANVNKTAIDDLKKEYSNQGNLSKVKFKMLTGEAVKIVCFGDSITYGTGGVNAYPNILQTRLRSVYNNNNITVINEGHSGWTTRNALDILGNIIAYKADLVIVMFGINDTRDTSLVQPDEYRENLLKITQELKSSGSEVLLCSPTPILETGDNRNKRLQIYAQIVKEVSSELNEGFADLHSEMNRLFSTTEIYPSVLLPDNIHFKDADYKIVSDIILYKILQFNEATKIIYVDTREEFSVPIVGSTYFVHNLSATYSNDDQVYYKGYILNEGKYLRFDFYCSQPNMSLILQGAKNRQGGQLNVIDNGSAVTIVDFYAPAFHLYNVESVLIDNLSIGWHSVLLDYDNMVKGQSESDIFNGYLTSFIFRPIKPSENVSYEYGSAAPSLEVFESVIKGTLRVKNPSNAGWKGVMLKSSPCVSIKSEKKLVIEVEGLIPDGSGITWFGNTFQTLPPSSSAPYNNGYFVRLQSSAVTLHYLNNNNGLTTINNASATIDLNDPHVIRIEHDDNGNIEVYVDGSLIVSGSNTYFDTGYFGFLTSSTNSTIEITRFEFCYI